MPETLESKQCKERVLERIRPKSIDQVRGNLYKINLNNKKIFVKVEYSKSKQRKSYNDYWFGIPTKLFEDEKYIENLFFIIICHKDKNSSSEQVFVMSADQIQEFLPIKSAKDGSKKFHIYQYPNGDFEIDSTGKEKQNINQFIATSVIDFYVVEKNTKKTKETKKYRQSGLNLSSEDRKRTEEVAINVVKSHYLDRGWKVKSVETEKIGYDLHCTKNQEEEHAEVKGISGTKEKFVITRNEYRCSQKDPKFVLWVVTSVHDEPKLKSFTGAEFLENFNFYGKDYWVTPKKKE